MNTRVEKPDQLRRRLTTTWQFRHVTVILVAAAGSWFFLDSRVEWSAMHRWNRAFGDMAIVLIAAAMAIGPLSRLWSGLNGFVPWRRECGIYAVVLSVIHTAIILDGWVEWNLIRLFGYEFHPIRQTYVMVQHGFALANVLGIVALLYGLVLASTSNDLSQRVLRGSTWKFVQRGAYVLWILVLLHTGYFLYLHFQSFHRQLPAPNWAQVPFLLLIFAVAMLQTLAFFRTWRKRRLVEIER